MDIKPPISAKNQTAILWLNLNFYLKLTESISIQLLFDIKMDSMKSSVNCQNQLMCPNQYQWSGNLAMKLSFLINRQSVPVFNQLKISLNQFVTISLNPCPIISYLGNYHFKQINLSANQTKLHWSVKVWWLGSNWDHQYSIHSWVKATHTGIPLSTESGV